MSILKEIQGDLAADRKSIELMQRSLEANTVAATDLAAWKPQVDSKVVDLQAGLQDIRGKLDQLTLKVEEKVNPAYKVFNSEEIDVLKPTAAHLAVTLPKAVSGSDDHCYAKINRGIGHGVVTTYEPSPVTGAK